MPLYEIRPDQIAKVPDVTFKSVAIRERDDLQRLLRDSIEIVSPDTMILAEEFGDWEESRRRIDLLGLDKDARLVVVELKRTEEGGHMDLQAIRYAAMVSTMTFDQAVAAHGAWLRRRNMAGDARETILKFLDWDEPDEDAFASDVRIVLVSADFSREITTSILWLADHDVDVSCVRLRPYSFEGKVLVDVQRIIPLPEAADYMERVRGKKRAERQTTGSRDYTRFDVTVDGVPCSNQPKRRAAFLVIKKLCDSGVTPEQIAEVIDWKSNLWRSADGKLNSGGFVEAGIREASAQGRAFDATRWYCTDDELVHSQGRTYAISNQWGGRTGEALEKLIKAWPGRGVGYEVSG